MSYSTIEAAAKAYAKKTGTARGWHGGWIYALPSYEPICQGWWTYAKKLLRRGAIVVLADGRFGVRVGIDADVAMVTAARSLDDLLSGCRPHTGYTPTLRPDGHTARDFQLATYRIRAALNERGVEVYPSFGSYEQERASA